MKVENLEITKELNKAKKQAIDLLYSVINSEFQCCSRDYVALIHESIETVSTSFEKYFLTTVSAKLCKSLTKEVEFLGLAAELIMFSALTVDDFLDQTKCRNNYVPIYLKRGEGKAILASFALIDIFEDCLQKGLNNGVTEEVKTLIRKQFWRAFRDIQVGQYTVCISTQESVLSVEFLDKLAHLRCGSLIGACFSVGPALSGNKKKYASFYNSGIWIGKALQHRNDIIDFILADNQKIKPCFEDFVNGQANIVSVFIFKNFPKLNSAEQEAIKHMYGRKTIKKDYYLTDRDKSVLAEVLKKTNALTLACLELKTCIDNAYSCIEPELNCDSGEKLLQFLDVVKTV